jgi:hypothetical protein
MYQDINYPDSKAIYKVRIADLTTKPNAVIVVGTVLKVLAAKTFAQNIYCAVCKSKGFTA